MITEEDFESRIERYKTDLLTLRNQLTLTEGAILDCEHWLSVLKEKLNANS